MKTKIMMSLSLLLSQLALGKPQPNRNCGVLSEPENVVSVPSYTDTNPCEEAKNLQEKTQYEPPNDELPIFEKEVSQKELVEGAYYPRADELYISPDFDFFSTRESIPESEETEGMPNEAQGENVCKN